MSIFKYKSAVSPVVATALLLVVVVVSVVGFSGWFEEFSSGVFVDVETGSYSSNSLRVEGLVNNQLYLKSDFDNINNLKISSSNGSEKCNFYNGYNDSNLEGYWDFDMKNDSHILDVSNNSNSAFIDTLVNFQSGISDLAYSTEGIGSGGVIYLDNISTFNFMLNDFYVGTWVKVDKFGTNGQSLISKGDWRSSQSGEVISLLVRQGNIKFGAGYHTENTLPLCVPTYDLQYLNDSSWHFISGQRIHNVTELYFDGVLVDSEQCSVNPAGNSTFPLTFGASSYANAHYLNGSMDEIRIYSRSLDSNEIKNLYNFNSLTLNLHNGINKIPVYGCNLKKNEKYNILVFTDSGLKIDVEVIAK